MKKILLVGFGNLGYRYFQGLLKVGIPLEIHILDIKKISNSEIQRELIFENIENIKCQVIDDSKPLDEFYHIAIIATTAVGRGELISKISRSTKIDFWIIEKIISQSVEEALLIENSIDKTSIGWVNYPRRMMPLYKELEQLISDKENIIVEIEGFEWNLASNALHFIDLVEFLFGTKLLEVDTSFIEKKWKKSKRKGFIEVNGEMKCLFKGNIRLSLKSNDNPNNIDSSIKISVFGKNLECKIVEKGHAIDGEINSLVIKGKLELQSQLTTIIIRDVLDRGSCDLVTLTDAVVSHKIFLSELINHFNINYNQKLVKLQIT